MRLITCHFILYISIQWYDTIRYDTRVHWPKKQSVVKAAKSYRYCWKEETFQHTLSMFSHYPGKFNSSNLLQITTKKIKKMRRLCPSSYGWIEKGVLFSTAYARSVRRSPARMHEDVCAAHCQWCSGRRYATLAENTVSVRVRVKLFYRIVSYVAHPRLVQSLLDVATDPVINRNKVMAVCWLKIWWNERRRCSRSRTVSRAGVLGRCPVEGRRIPLIPRASRVAALTRTRN